jgi:hypothetical protein
MKRIDRCLCAPHVTRILVIAIVAPLVFLGIYINSPAQSTWQQSGFCIEFPAGKLACPVYDGRVNLKLPTFPDEPAKSPPHLKFRLQAAELSQRFRPPEDGTPNDGGTPYVPLQPTDTTGGFDWNKAIAQSTLFLAISHGFRLATEPGTRAELKGPFFKDYWASVRNLRGWGDGDDFLVNYIGHPMGGSVAGFIQIQNDPKGLKQEVGLNNKKYWQSRMRAMAWAAAYSTQFEIGPISEASLGNVGRTPTEKSQHPMGWVDLVITPTMGTAWLVGEDLLDRYLIRWIESKIKNRTLIIITRTFLNPTRSFANMHRGELFWRRENRP